MKCNLRMAKHTKCVQAIHDCMNEGEGEISQPPAH